MGGYQRGHTAFDQVAQDGTGNRGAFLGIGSGSQLIQNHQRPRVGLAQDVDDVGDMPAEGAQRLLNGLLVPDVGIHRIETQQGGATLGRDVEAALGHKDQQAHGLKRDRLAARVWPRDDNGERAWLWVHINRHDRVRIQQRVACVQQANRRRWRTLDVPCSRILWFCGSGTGMEHRLTGAERLGKLGLGEGEVKCRQVLDSIPQIVRMHPHESGEFSQNSAFLVALGQLQLPDLIVQVDNGQRLNEKGCTRGGLIVHDCLDLPFELSAQRYHVAAVPLCNDRFLELVC